MQKLKQLSTFAISLLIATTALLPAGYVLAQNTTDPDAPVSQDTQEDNESDTTDQRAKLLERLEKRKEARKLRLSFVEQTRLKSRCKASQGLLKAANVRIKTVETRRDTVYANLIERLTNVSAKLKAAGLDTAELDAAIADLQAQVDEFSGEIAEYKQIVADISEMDCAEDPEAFKASLETARTMRQELVKKAQTIRTTLKDDIKPILLALRDQLPAEGEDS